uniref:Proton ATPase E n=1 Tax=Polyandrocarpa misakiensis TaxID=7723 RepID=A0A1W7GYX4_POLMI|nr:proton ATPase E [Polyandrocarpa misakiensis]
MGLSDAEVKKQIDHMIAFIVQEADEKAEEIDAKAEEEFQIEKQRLVQQQRQKIMEFYSKKEKQLEQQRRIQQSQLVNSARLNLLKKREEYIDKILDEARDGLGEIRKDPKRYRDLLEGLISQGLFQLLESEISLRCKRDDVAAVREAIPKAVQRLEQESGIKATITINENDWLGGDISGGVIMSAHGGRIKVENTLESRLNLVSKQILPETRVRLFGQNRNRKFMD